MKALPDLKMFLLVHEKSSAAYRVIKAKKSRSNTGNTSSTVESQRL